MLANDTLDFSTLGGNSKHALSRVIETVPEPVTMVLLGMGALALLRKRR